MLRKNCYNSSRIMATYPRTQTVVTFIVCAVVIGGVATYVYGGALASLTKKKGSSVAVISATSSSTDQLIETASWKETFFNVTDASGKKYETSSATNISAGSEVEKITATDIFGREFFSKYMSLRKTGMIENTDAKDALVDQIIESGQMITDGPKVYTVADLKIAAVEDDASREAYANAVAHTMVSHQPAEHEGMIAKEALETGDNERLADIDPIIVAYSTVRSDLLAIPAPLSATQYHLNLVNGMSEAVANAVSLRNTLTDPLQTLATLSRYQMTEKNVFDTVVNLRAYFNSYGIVFSPTDSAYSVFSLK